MSQSVLPFPFQTGGAQCNHGVGCSLQMVLPPPLRDACERADFLADYLHQVPLGDIGIPVYYPRFHASCNCWNDATSFILLTAVCLSDIYPDAVAARDHYVSIEPTVMVNLDEVMLKIDERLRNGPKTLGGSRRRRKEADAAKGFDQICTTELATG
ncbi:hypothetical protein [Candidatus Amarobacter glycogenicus]|uniref:hypothetical protein n=1 Tax=Candidatus Amarobacter glycogenicus TaxID=3140699 RepID=UPI002A136792|nr:hypothetical protein [Dehalococcoidia bacterium]